MSSIFSVARILGKSRAKRVLPTRSPSSMSGSTADKEKNGTPKSSTIALPIPTPIPPPPPTTHAVSVPLVAESPKAGPYKELEPAPEQARSSTSTSETIPVVEAEPQAKVETLHEEPVVAQVPPPVISEISEAEKPLVLPAVTSVEEPGYDVISQPEAPKSEVGWTEVEPSNNSNVPEKSVESSEVVPGDISRSDDVSTSAPQIPQQDGAVQVLSEKEIASSEVVSGLTQKIQDTEAALHATREELETKYRTIEDLLLKIDTLQNSITTLEKSKEEIFAENIQEKNELVEEIHRLKGIIGMERLDSREKAESLVMEKEAVEAEMEIQRERISRLEERLAEGREETEGVYARNRDLETQLRRYEEVVKKEADDDTHLVAEKDNHIQMLEKNNENLSSQLVQLQSSLNETERQNRMFLDQLRRQSNELQLQARKNTLGHRLGLGSTIWGMAGGSRVESAISTMKSLNEEIFQIAAALTDQLEDIPKRFVVVVEDSDEGTSAKAEILKSMLGLELVKNLQQEAQLPSEEYNPLFIQIALQGCLTASCMRIITSWYPTEWEYGNLLVALYERIRGTANPVMPGVGGPEIALSWKKATQQSCAPSTDRNSKLIVYLTEQIEAVLTVSGWSTSSPVADLLKVKYAQNLAGIVSHALRLNGLTTATGENRDVEGVSVEAGKMFNPILMTNDSPFDDFARKSRMDSTPDEEVICTTALGLKSADIDSTKPDQILLKPKVFLHGGLL